MPTRAMILAAGRGLRMAPLTDTMPKPLVPVRGKPLIDYSLDWLAASGVADVVVNSSYLADMLEAHLAARAAPRVRISREAERLETGGGIKKALPLLGDAPFFSLNSDAICIDGPRPALHRLWQAWDGALMDALLLLHPVEQAVGFEGAGDFFADSAGVLKRRGDAPHAPYVFTGVQLVHPRLFADSPDGAFSLNVLYNRDMASDGTLHRIAGLVHDGAWLHVGDTAGLRQAEQRLQAR